MQKRPPSRAMVRIIELLRDGPRDRAGIAGALKLRECVAASVLTAMEYRQIVLKDGDRYSLLK
jgi:predicted transcriptional regulator